MARSHTVDEMEKTKTYCAYLAGFFDADGTIWRSSGHGWNISITNKNEAVLHWLNQRFGGRITTQGNKGVYQLYWRVNEMRGVLLDMLPHLIVKRERANRCLWKIANPTRVSHGPRSNIDRRCTRSGMTRLGV